jgi:hypothetical protein
MTDLTTLIKNELVFKVHQLKRSNSIGLIPVNILKIDKMPLRKRGDNVKPAFKFQGQGKSIQQHTVFTLCRWNEEINIALLRTQVKRLLKIIIEFLRHPVRRFAGSE